MTQEELLKRIELLEETLNLAEKTLSSLKNACQFYASASLTELEEDAGQKAREALRGR